MAKFILSPSSNPLPASPASGGGWWGFCFFWDNGLKPHCLFLVFLLLTVIPGTSAQEDEKPRLLTDSINPETGVVTVNWVDLQDRTLTPVTTFNATSYCLPDMITADNTLLYEPALPGQSPYVYKVDLSTGASLPIAGDQLPLQCPVVSPGDVSIAWLETVEGGRQVTMTDLEGQNPIPFVTHSDIYDVMWSPDGKILIYTATDEGDETFNTLYAHSDAQVSFWERDAGLVVDYAWVPDGSALLVAYYTQDNAEIGRLSRECVQLGGCLPDPLAVFGLDASLILTGAFSPDGSEVLVIEETSNATGEPRSDMYRIDVDTLNGGGIRFTDSPTLIKTSPIWVDDNTIYFIGSLFDTGNFTFARSAIYEIDPEGAEMRIAFEAEGFYPAQIIWWER